MATRRLTICEVKLHTRIISGKNEVNTAQDVTPSRVFDRSEKYVVKHRWNLAGNCSREARPRFEKQLRKLW